MLAADVAVEAPSQGRRGVGVILLSSCLFGAMAVCVRVAAREMPALQIAFVRFLGSFLVLLALSRGRGLTPRAGNLKRVLQRGVLGSSSVCCYYLGIQGAGAGLATLLHCTYPVWTALFAATFMGERASTRVIAALALNLVGVLIVVGAGAQLGAQVNSGAMWALAASVLAGGALSTARHLRATEEATLITTYFMFVGATITAPALLTGVPLLSPSLMMALGGVILTSVAGQWLLHHGLGFTSATQGSLTAATCVVSASLFEAVFLGQVLSAHTLLGAGFMIAAVGLAARRQSA